ncbi:hypothetical protein MTBGP_11340 [Moorella thermoacetica]|uniref:hypothetical protein n=1 Tax=Neomoorella thermoacetica TaxID=1525 RepID=UPI0030D1B555
MLNHYVPLKCDYCGEDLLKKGGNVIFMTKFDYSHGTKEYISIYFACKGDCDVELTRQNQVEGISSGWRDVKEFTNPYLYLNFIMAFINGLKKGHKYSEQAYERMKDIFLIFGQKVFRQPTHEEMENANLTFSLPPI